MNCTGIQKKKRYTSTCIYRDNDKFSFPPISPINSIQGKILKNILKHTRAYILANNCHYMYNYFIRKQNLEIKGCNVTNFHIDTCIEYHT